MIPASKYKKILLIDNDTDIPDVMQAALTYEGYEVNSLQEIDNIVPEIMQFKPDLIILDYLPDGINGGELCHQIKINHHSSKLPVIMISAYAKVLQSLGSYGINMFIPKPFDLGQLVGCIPSLNNGCQQPEGSC